MITPGVSGFGPLPTVGSMLISTWLINEVQIEHSPRVSLEILLEGETILVKELSSIDGIAGDSRDSELGAEDSPESRKDSSSILQHIPQNSPVRSENDL